MHWSPEHAAALSQWPEQHLDVSSTTSPPSGHKHDPYSARRGYPPSGYPWASDDISALTASSLLKRYAEKYSGLELPYERPATGAYSEPGTFLKTESEPWTLSQSNECYPGLEALAAGAKVGTGPGGLTVVTTDLGYSGAGSCSAPPSQDYPSAYNSTYLSSGYCSQPSPALPPAPLHSLQSTPTLVPSYNPTSPVYNYPPGCYPHPQTSLASGYSHPSASYLPSGLSAPTPLAPRPTVVGGNYGYTAHSLGASGSDSGGALKRKAFDMAEDEVEPGREVDAARYRKYGNGQGNGHGKSHSNDHSNNYDLAISDGQAYKSGKPLVSSPYGGAGEYSPPSDPAGESAVGDRGFPQQQRVSIKMPAPLTRSEDPSGGH